MKEKRRILVREDDHMLGEMIETLLGIRDFEVFRFARLQSVGGSYPPTQHPTHSDG